MKIQEIESSSNWIPNAPFLAGICAALAALLITIERSLSFGAR
jgi:hypothetical protein